MLISLNWLSDHLDLDGLSVDDVSRLLTFAGVEVENIQQRGVTSDRIVVGQILEFGKHPDADKLSVCRVDDGRGASLQIVCGARNFQAGDKVALALEGAELPGDFKIRKTKMRGVESAGMMCSGKELGMSDDAAGLLILPPEAPVGVPLRAYLGSDTLIEIEVTPNRPDLLSHHGLARELSALTGRALRSAPRQAGARPVIRAVEKGDGSESPGTIRLDAPDACPLYSARIIRGVKVEPSPAWLRQKLEAIALRPINNVVDVTNFVLHETGQPLHAFDLAKLDGGIVVRAAQPGETVLALDGKTYALTTDDLVIADQIKPVAIAGVMGGEKTAVIESTADVLLESAYFAPARVRRTSRRLGLSSDSSYRFERGVDPQVVLDASALATRLILELAGGNAEESVHVAGQAPVVTGRIALDPAAVSRLLGVEVPAEKTERILSALGLEKTDAAWQVPSFRGDLQRPVDLIEEVARVMGIEGIPSRTAAEFSIASKEDQSYDFRIRLKRTLAALGFFEARTIKFISDRQLADTLGTGRRTSEPLLLKNPLNDDLTIMRPSLVPGLLEVAEHNVRHGADVLRFYEMGTTFAQSLNPNAGAAESQALAILLSGPHAPGSWLKKAPHATDVFDLRGVLETILARRDDLRLRRSQRPGLVLAADITIDGKVVGLAGQLAPARVRKLGARHPVFVAELDLGVVEPLLSRSARYEELPRFPAITRDVALEAPAGITHDEINEILARQRQAEPLLESIALFDVFSDPTGEKLPAGKKSLAYSLTYRDKTKTLEAGEADAAHKRVIEAVKNALPVSIR